MKNKKRVFLGLIIFLFFFTSSMMVHAQEDELSTPTSGEIKSAQGSQFQTGWNYFSVDSPGCTVGKILDELQADGGGALIAESLWVKEEEWVKHDFAEITQSASLVDANRTLAFFSNTDFFFDLNLDVCDTEDPEREEQILGLRAIQNKDLAAKKSLVEKITALPFEFWQNFWDFVNGGEKEKAGQDLTAFSGGVALEELIVTGRTNLNDLGITGMTTAGLLVFDGLEGSINTLSDPLKLQDMALGNLEMMGGKIIFDTEGNIVVNGTIKADEFEGQKIKLEEGITLKDKNTEEYYCLMIEDGEIVKEIGECQAIPTPTPEGEI